ncbi:MAG: hypothetical protein JNK49_20600 [Planctomycetes bacterium]|nr:hypothetical protein [Planctomycetota bacterium]
MFHFEYTGQGWQHFVSEAWGECRRLIEVSDDQAASRQIDIYHNGLILTYDRSKPRDAYGMLIGLRFSLKSKWKSHFPDPRFLSLSDFDEVWRAASSKAVQQAAAARLSPQQRHSNQ